MIEVNNFSLEVHVYTWVNLNLFDMSFFDRISLFTEEVSIAVVPSPTSTTSLLTEEPC